MSQNANPINPQMPPDNSTSATQIPSPQETLPPCSPVQATPTIVDAAVFAGTRTTGPVQVRDGTPHLSFVPIGGTFSDATTAPQTKPIGHANKDGENNAPSPLALSPNPPRTEENSSPPPIPIPPRSQSSDQPGTNSVHRSVLIGADTDRE